MAKSKFTFDMGDPVTFTVNKNLNGEVIGRAEFATSENQYLVRYADSNDNPTEQWWDEGALEEGEAEVDD
jgi:hypothetical protein